MPPTKWTMWVSYWSAPSSTGGNGGDRYYAYSDRGRGNSFGEPSEGERWLGPYEIKAPEAKTLAQAQRIAIRRAKLEVAARGW